MGSLLIEAFSYFIGNFKNLCYFNHMSDETLIQNPDTKIILEAIAELSKKVDSLEKRMDSHDAQFETIRLGKYYQIVNEK